jgi:ferredoxin
MLFKKKQQDVRPEAGGHTKLKPKPEEDPDFHKYRVEYNRAGCIGGDICTFIDPKHFAMNKADGKADFVGAKLVDGKWVIEEISDPTMIEPGGELRRAADCCPAGVIRVVRIKTGEKVAGH